jgi:hypothetical protein
MWANWHAPGGIREVTLVINTVVDFIDARGHTIQGGNLHSATRIVEKFDSIEVNPPDLDQPEEVPGGFKHSIDAAQCAAKT